MTVITTDEETKHQEQQHAPRSTSHPTSQILNSLHLDFIHDVAFDYYGRRIATCGDRTVKVWDLDASGEWTFQPGSSGSDWQAHRGSVTRLSWAHPEFGQLLATCGSDHAATIWEEREGGFSLPKAGMGAIPPSSVDSSSREPPQVKRWVSKAQLSDARKAVSCVQFAPKHLGLKLATGSADGFVRIYEAIDVMNLNHWPMNGSIEAEDTGTDSELGVTSLSWCTGRFEPPTLVVGGSSGKVSVYRYSDASRQWYLAVKLPQHGRGVHDVSWAPNVGRSYHLIATCGKDKVLQVHRLKREKEQNQKSTILTVESSQTLDTDNAEVWRCAWNVTGTVLSSSGDIVQLWKSDFCNEWKCVSRVHGDK